MKLMFNATCKTTDSKIVHYSAYYSHGSVEIVGPNLERHRCHPSVKNTEDAQIEIAKVYDVDVISVTSNSWDLTLAQAAKVHNLGLL
jgi:hypothetical protein